MSDTLAPRAHTRTLTNMLRSFTLLARAVLLASLIGTACAPAPDKSCCVAVYGTGPEEGNNRATVCDSCAKLATFECRPSHAPADGTVSDNSTDCISFAYADEATCLAVDGAQAWWTSSDNDGNGCPATTTSFPAWACTATCGDSAAYSVTVRTNPDAFPQFPRHAWPAKARFSRFHRRHARNAGGAAATPTVP
jgi:hypothetical protein